jgi:Glycosyl transferase family 2
MPAEQAQTDGSEPLVTTSNTQDARASPALYIMEEDAPRPTDPSGPPASAGPVAPLIMADSFEAANATIILPTLNEEAGISQTLLDIPFDRLAAAGWRVRPLVVDGGSTDRTLEVAAAWGVPVLHQKSRGKGGAIREAIDWLAEKNVQYAVVLDADGSYPGASVLPALELLDAGSHLVVGVRQSATGPPRNSRDLLHRVGNALLNFVAGQVSRSRILDVCSGFWGVQVERARELGLESYDFGIEAELFLKGQRAGWTILQIPIPYRERVGEAKLHAVSDGVRILLSIIRFGHKTLQEAPPATSLLPVFIRDLLVTALIGGGDLVLVTPPSREQEARAVAFLLERSDLRPRVVVRPETPEPSLPLAPISAPEGENDGAAVVSPSALDPPLPGNAYMGPVIRFGERHQALYVEMPVLEKDPITAGTVFSSAGDSARSGAYQARPKSQSDLFDPIRTLASRLNTDDREVRTNFLEANGLAVQETNEDPEELLRAETQSRRSRTRPPGGSSPRFPWGRVRT